MNTVLKLVAAAFLAAGFVQTAAWAGTDGTASFTVTMSDPGGKYKKRVDAFWVTDANGVFVQNVRKDAGKRMGFLHQWKAARQTSAVDGFSGATIGTWTPVTVTWDCRDTNNVVVPDGTYKFYVEFTGRNGQGPWTTNGIAFVKGLAGVTNQYPDQGKQLTGMSVVFTPKSE